MVQSLARVQGLNQQDILAKLLSMMARHCWKRLWPAEEISHHCTQQYDRKCYYPNQILKYAIHLTKWNTQGESRQPCHSEGPGETPWLSEVSVIRKVTQTCHIASFVGFNIVCGGRQPLHKTYSHLCYFGLLPAEGSQVLFPQPLTQW